MEHIHILQVPVEYTLWKPLAGTECADGSIYKDTDTVVTDCCVCGMPAAEVRWRMRCTPFDPSEPYRYPPYDPEPELECNPDAGCNVNPRRKNGSILRREMRELV